jgi:corrinoid protein of di/trimethylamine methyltransferase
MADESVLLSELTKAVLDGDEEAGPSLARRALDAGVPPLEIIDRGLLPGINEAGRLWDEGDYFLPELVGAAQAMKSVMAILQPLLARDGTSHETGRVVIGTVQGDIHDIGKTLVATLLTAGGFTVSDEGANVSVEKFVARAREVDADIVCASALLTTTMAHQKDLVAAVREAGLRAKVCVGGAPVTREWAREIGADGWADNAVAAVAVARSLVPSHGS